ncbi:MULTISPECIES: helix-turn-helix domain-containing protein [unclassified Streptomyces]|uniref:helix-turn-helix domain-containing protein n=1 Tax=unclassified Streptomyces TaxID=2593676 RepID=UPI002E77BD97|nr:helix-turn-helix domain-containing protein [Streptomyces sp. JV176]MEE1804002.1 helix-turn-helix domain-containing protein [Streptomyces sp. JV176]
MSGARPVAAECARLAAELSALRESTGLSLAALAARTPYSKSSWQRYLNGTKPVPRTAVTVLCALAREPADRLLALWELSDAAWSGRAGTVPAASAAPAPAASVAAPAPVPVPVAAPAGRDDRDRRGGRGGRGGRLAVWLLVGGAVAGAAVTALVVGRPDVGEGVGASGGRPPVAAEWGTANPVDPKCVGAACVGLNPGKMFCAVGDVVKNLSTFTASGGQRLELRYGETCRALWLRTTGLRVGEYAELRVPGEQAQRIVVRDTRAAASYLSTAIAGDGNAASARICLGTEANGSEVKGSEVNGSETKGSEANSSEECFDWQRP